MTDSFNYKNDRPWPNHMLTRGVIIGHTTHNSARLWLRTGVEGKFTVVLFSPDNENAKKHFSEIRSTANGDISFAVFDKFIKTDIKWENDTTAVVDFNDLKPGTDYRYAVWNNESQRFIIGHDKKRRFATPTDTTDTSPFCFGLMSCHMPFKGSRLKSSLFGQHAEVRNMGLWDIAAEVCSRHEKSGNNLDFFIAGGDQAYADGIDALNIWKYLNKKMRRENGELLPKKEDMLSWYRDIYRGYWGFPVVQGIYSRFPTYMIWDDHEIMDGWGSYKIQSGKELHKIFPKRPENITDKDARVLLKRMKDAAFQAYREYEHSHNPETEEGIYDYHFNHKGCCVYVLDGRGHRDFDNDSYKILGKEQFDRFSDTVRNLNPDTTKFLFVISAVPVLHSSALVADKEGGTVSDMSGLDDDLRDAWENKAHDDERSMLLDLLFDAAKKGIHVCILSGDVHVSAVFKLCRSKDVIYQLTSSPITYNVSRPLGILLGLGAADSGKSEKDNYKYERLALYTKPSFSLIKVDPKENKAVFQLYGEQEVEAFTLDVKEKRLTVPKSEKPHMITNSIAKIQLDFSPMKD